MMSRKILEVSRSGEEKATRGISQEHLSVASSGVTSLLEQLHIDGEGRPRKLRALRVSANFSSR